MTHVLAVLCSLQFVFNGDLVDRGPSGIEVACLVFAFVLVYPKSVFVNRCDICVCARVAARVLIHGCRRGNHEDRIVNLACKPHAARRVGLLLVVLTDGLCVCAVPVCRPGRCTCALAGVATWQFAHAHAICLCTVRAFMARSMRSTARTRIWICHAHLQCTSCLGTPSTACHLRLWLRRRCASRMR